YRIYEVNVLHATQQPRDRLAYVRVQVHRIDHLDVAAARDAGEATTNALKPVSKAFAAMACYQYQAARRIEVREVPSALHRQGGVRLQPAGDTQEGIDDGVPGHMDLL